MSMFISASVCTDI